MTILRTRVVVKRIATTSTVEASTSGSGTAPTFEADSTSFRNAPAESSLNFGVSITGPAIETVLLATVGDAEDLAAYLAGVNSAYPQLAEIIIQSDDDMQAAIIRDIDLNDRIIATETVTGAELDGFVEQIEHRVTNGGLNHELRLLVSARGRLIGLFAATSPADIASQFTDDPPDGFNYAVFGSSNIRERLWLGLHR